MREALHRVEEGLIALILGVMTLLTVRPGRPALRLQFRPHLGARGRFLPVRLAGAARHLLRRARSARISASMPRVKLLPPRAAAHRRPDRGRRFGAALRRADDLRLRASISTACMIIDIEAEDIPVKRWILSLCLPIGFALLFLRLLEMALAHPARRSPGYELADEAHGSPQGRHRRRARRTPRRCPR